MRAKETIIALIHGPDQPGLVARVSGWIFERGGNIIHADQHRDMEEEVFFQRIEWTPSNQWSDCREEGNAFAKFAREFNMRVDCKVSSVKPQVAVFVSRYGHCFHELFLGQKSGELPCEISCVVSNHQDLREAAEGYGVDFYHVPVTPETRGESTSATIGNLTGTQGGFGSDGPLHADSQRGFFKQSSVTPSSIFTIPFYLLLLEVSPTISAHQRGVKLIGATAHYATAILDEGPIIQQDVGRVSHRHTVKDLIVRGRMLERRVLTQAVRWHLEHRILVYGRKTVVFD